MSERTIYARRIMPNGLLHPYIPIANHPSEPCVEPAVAFSPLHGYVVSWRHVPTLSDWDVYARLVKPGHNSPDGAEFAIDTFPGLQKSPAVACDQLGDCLIVEQDIFGATDYEIRGRFVRSMRLYLPLVVR